jgi:hypothetical protein
MKWGYIDKTGEWAITPRYLEVRFFSEGFAGVRVNAKTWGYIDKQGALVIPDKYDAIDQFQEGWAMVQVGKKAGYIDTKGQLVWPLTE